MDEQPIPVTPKRRRIIVALGALIVLVLAGVGFIYRPRLDPRFLGKWIERPGELYEAEWTFKDDGTLSVYTYSARAGGVKVVVPYRWFVFLGRFYQSSGDISSTASHAWKVLRRTAEAPNVVIEQVTRDSIVLRPVFPGPKDDAQLIRLTRIAE